MPGQGRCRNTVLAYDDKCCCCSWAPASYFGQISRVRPKSTNRTQLRYMFVNIMALARMYLHRQRDNCNQIVRMALLFREIRLAASVPCCRCACHLRPPPTHRLSSLRKQGPIDPSGSAEPPRGSCFRRNDTGDGCHRPGSSSLPIPRTAEDLMVSLSNHEVRAHPSTPPTQSYPPPIQPP